MMVVHDLFTKRKSYTGTFKFFFGVEPFKNCKNLFCMFLFKANSIILKNKLYIIYTCMQIIVLLNIRSRKRSGGDRNFRPL